MFKYDPVVYLDHTGGVEKTEKDLIGATHVETYTKDEKRFGGDKTLIVFAFYPDDISEPVVPCDAFVLWWKHSDGSGQNIVRVYLNETRANEDYELVKASHDREWFLDKVTLK